MCHNITLIGCDEQQELWKENQSIVCDSQYSVRSLPLECKFFAFTTGTCKHTWFPTMKGENGFF